MKVKYIGMGGGYAEYPCYEDGNGRIYFDLNNGRNGLDLYTGAYRSAESKDICGEPEFPLTEAVECEEPFVRSAFEQTYRMLGRLRSDCEYFLGYGDGFEGHLYYGEVNKHCAEMVKLWESLPETEKPEWLTLEQIGTYREQMLLRRNG